MVVVVDKGEAVELIVAVNAERKAITHTKHRKTPKLISCSYVNFSCTIKSVEEQNNHLHKYDNSYNTICSKFKYSRCFRIGPILI